MAVPAARLRVRTRSHFFEQIFPAQRPVVLVGVLRNWPLLTPRLDAARVLGRMSERAGARRVQVTWSHARHAGRLFYGNPERGDDKNWSCDEKSFGSFVDDLLAELKAPSEHVQYLQSTDVSERLPELVSWFPAPFLTAKELETGSTRLWMGNGGHRSPLHYDPSHNINCVVAGKKRFILFPPSALPHVYLGPLNGSPVSTPISFVDPLRPDIERYPRFKLVERQAIVAELGPGDALFIPSFWFHHVESFGVNVAVNYWWSQVSEGATQAALTTLCHGLLHLRSLPEPNRSFFKILFDHFVFHENGDPYPHLPKRRQGIAGVPTPETEAMLRGMVRDGAAAESGFDPKLKYVVDAVSFRLAKGGFEVRRDAKNVSVLSADLVKLLREFTAPSTPAAVARRLNLGPRERRDLMRTCERLSTEGLLLRYVAVAEK